MNGGENKMFFVIDEIGFLLSVSSPKEKYEVVVGIRKMSNNVVSKLFPTLFLMRTSLMLAYGKGGIEEKNALLCPSY